MRVLFSIANFLADVWFLNTNSDAKEKEVLFLYAFVSKQVLAKTDGTKTLLDWRYLLEINCN